MEESELPHPRETTTENPLWIRFQQQIQPLPLVGFGVHGVAVATVSHRVPQEHPQVRGREEPELSSIPPISCPSLHPRSCSNLHPWRVLWS